MIINFADFFLLKLGETMISTGDISDVYESDTDSNETHANGDNYQSHQFEEIAGCDLNSLVIEINKNKLNAIRNGALNELNRMNNCDELILANDMIESNALISRFGCKKYGGSSFGLHAANGINGGIENDSFEESEDSSLSQTYNGHLSSVCVENKLIELHSQHYQQQNDMFNADDSIADITDITDLTLLSSHLENSELMNNKLNSDDMSFHSTASHFEYDDLSYIDQQSTFVNDNQNLNLDDYIISVTVATAHTNELNGSDLITDDNLSKLIVPPPPKIVDLLEEQQNKALNDFHKATEDVKKICGQKSATLADYDFSTFSSADNTQIRDLHSSSSADSGYDSVFINGQTNNQKSSINSSQQPEIVRNELIIKSRKQKTHPSNHIIKFQKGNYN